MIWNSRLQDRRTVNPVDCSWITSSQQVAFWMIAELPLISKIFSCSNLSWNLEGGKATENRNHGRVQKRTETPFGGAKAYLHDGKMIKALISDSCSTQNQEDGLVPLDHSGEKDDGAYYPAKEVKEMGLQSEEDKKQMQSRLAAPEVAPRSLPLGMELTERNKRPAIICGFFVKGWCIRGSSCRFLHVKDNPDSSSKQPVEEKRNERDKGLRDDSEACPPGMLDRLGSSSNQNSSALASSSSSVLPVDPSLPSTDRGDSSKYDDGFISSYRNVIRNGLGRRRYDEDYKIYTSLINRGTSFTLRSNFLADYGHSPNGSVRSLSIHEREVPTSCFPSHSLNSSLNAPPLAFSSLSSNASPLDAQNFLGSEYRSASLLESSSFSSGSGLERHSLQCGNNKRKFSPYNWEPSVPFRPSFSIASVLPSLGHLYDPFHDSIEQPKAGDGVYRASEQQISGQTKGNRVSGCENENSVSSHNQILEQVADKDCHTHGRDSFAAPAETAENSIVDCQNEDALPEESSRPLKENSEVDVRNRTGLRKSDQARLRKDLKDERVRKKVEKSMHHNTNAEEPKESKLLRHFRFVLIDFVKALLRPRWEGGRLTKDAHNLIVKKAVDKVMGTLSPEQVPTSKHLIKEYLSLSEPRIVKLVEAYVDKYGKPCEAS
ncbi:hypothetical protein CDL15_Pgr000151 [Punica granatum]|uniref:C3H1-type domain-containing protein n=1 Tax=Punica granatum TaxID=22663 RepID=A0A218Y1M5_PUNGR|nr:hypothetical protein CDL15_Pgr000151 [Punica granatum]